MPLTWVLFLALDNLSHTRYNVSVTYRPFQALCYWSLWRTFSPVLSWLSPEPSSSLVLSLNLVRCLLTTPRHTLLTLWLTLEMSSMRPQFPTSTSNEHVWFHWGWCYHPRFCWYHFHSHYPVHCVQELLPITSKQMIYHLKGLVARFLDIFDPDDVTYIVLPTTSMDFED